MQLKSIFADKLNVGLDETLDVLYLLFSGHSTTIQCV